MTTEKRWPKPGQTLVHKSPRTGAEVVAEVVAVDEQQRKVTVRVGSQLYPSLSSAAKAITGSSTNGWVYWGLKRKNSPTV